jgi:hypothetical protein
MFNQVGWTYVHMRWSHGWDPADATEEIVALLMSGIEAHPQS